MTKIIPNLKVFILLIFFTLLILASDFTHLLDLPKKGAFYITNPISFSLYKLNKDVSKQFEFIFNMRQAAQQNLALQEQIGKLLSENADLRKKLSETESLLSQEKHIDPRTYNLLPARPIGLAKYLKIDKGSNDGIKMGQAVIVNDNYVGRIIQVSPKASSIQMLSDPDSKVAAFSINKEGKGKGILIGQFGTEILMDKILHEEIVEVGDLVYSEGTEGFLPRGLILGRITQVQGLENELFKQAKVEPVFDIRDIELVFIIID